MNGASHRFLNSADDRRIRNYRGILYQKLLGVKDSNKEEKQEQVYGPQQSDSRHIF